MYVLTDKIGYLESYSIDMQALTGYCLSRTQVLFNILNTEAQEEMLCKKQNNKNGSPHVPSTRQKYDKFGNKQY